MTTDYPVENYGLIDKSAWGGGPWDSEPDFVQWRSDTGLPCVINRHPKYGHLCGYVGVNIFHPFFGREDTGGKIKVHGGLNWGGDLSHCQLMPSEDMRASRLISFDDDANNPGSTYWLGFDCGHAGDLSPGLRAMTIAFGVSRQALDAYEIYRDIEYVKRECEQLAGQLASINP